jgi:hypothetical protein
MPTPNNANHLHAEAAGLLQAAANRGELTPAALAELTGPKAPAWARDPGGVRMYLERLAATPDGLTAEELAVAKQMGLDPKAVAERKAARAAERN